MNKNVPLRKTIVWLVFFVLLVLLIAALTEVTAYGDEQKTTKTEWKVNPNLVKELIRVSIKTQRLYFFKNGKLIHTFLCSTSRGPIKPQNSHPKSPHDHVGTFTIDTKEILHKSKLFHGIPMPYALHYWSGHFIHQSSVVSRLGHPASHGCVRLSHKSAKWLYSQVKVGTKVEIR